MSDSETELALNSITDHLRCRNHSNASSSFSSTTTGRRHTSGQQQKRAASHALHQLLPYESLNNKVLDATGVSINSGGKKTSVLGVLRSALGPESNSSINLGNHELLSYAANSSGRTCRDSQLVVNDCIWSQTRLFLQKVCAQQNEILIVKRTWDEATLFFNMSQSDLIAIFGETARLYLTRPSTKLLDATKRKKPSFTAQVLQQEISFRWGPGKLEQQNIIVGARIVPQNSSQWLYAGIESSCPELSCRALAALADTVKWVILMVFPDGLFANNVVVFKMADVIQKAIMLKFICVAHCLSISINIGVDATDLCDAEYSLACSLSTASSLRRLKQGVERVLKSAVILPLVPPPLEASSFADLVLKYTVLREELTTSFFFVEGENTSFDVKREFAVRIKTHYNGDWRRLRPAHHCLKTVDGLQQRCHDTDEHARSDGSDIMQEVVDESILSVQKPSRNRWRKKQTRTSGMF